MPLNEGANDVVQAVVAGLQSETAALREENATLRRERDEARAALRDIAFGASADWAYLKELATAALASIRAEGTT